MGQQFYNANQNRSYPFRERVSLRDRSGNRLPEGLLVDMSLTVDNQHGQDIYVSSVARRGNYCSVVFSSATSLQPVGLVSTDRLSDQSRLTADGSPVLTIRPLQVGTVGHVILGEHLANMQDGTWVFDDPTSSLLQTRVIYPVASQASQRFGILGSVRALTGDLEFQVGGDIDVSIQNRQLAGRNRRAIVFGLRASQPELLASYAARQPRPESRTCGDPQPIESINDVTPDCCGRIFLEFRGCAAPVPITNHCGVVLDCPLTMVEICPERPNFRDNPDAADQCQAQTGNNPINPANQQQDSPHRWHQQHLEDFMPAGQPAAPVTTTTE